MPGYDGTGPKGEGPFTGRGEGYCAVKLPDEPGQPAVGYAGRQGYPVGPGAPPGLPARPWLYGPRPLPAAVWRTRPFWRRRGRGGRRGPWIRGAIR
jgi:hypothetical protein